MLGNKDPVSIIFDASLIICVQLILKRSNSNYYYIIYREDQQKRVTILFLKLSHLDFSYFKK